LITRDSETKGGDAMKIDLLMMKRKRGAIGLAVAGIVFTAMAADAWAGPRRARVVPRAPVRDAAWVMPVYETAPTVCTGRVREIWREPVYEERRMLVTLPATVVTRRIPRLNLFSVVVAYDVVKEVVEPAREVWRTERVLVKPGRYETVCEPVFVRPAKRIVRRAAAFRGHHGPPCRPPVVHRAHVPDYRSRPHALPRRHSVDGGLTIRIRR
jgi:hypothetical protein